MKNGTPSPRERQLLRTVRSFTGKHGYPPSLRQIADAMAVSSSRAAGLAASCERHGLLTHDTGVSRSWRCVEEAAAS